MSVKIVLWLLLSSAAIAQDVADDAAADSEQQSADETEISDQAQNGPRPDDLDSQPIDRPADQAPGRFIPSEQISLDLGVSFPVDI